MTTALDTKLRDAVEKILDKLGKAVEFDWSMAQEYDPATDQVTTIGEGRTEWKITPPARYRRDLVDGETILASDLQTYLRSADLPFTITPGSTVLRMDGETFEIVSVSSIYSGDDVVLYELQVRK